MNLATVDDSPVTRAQPQRLRAPRTRWADIKVRLLFIGPFFVLFALMFIIPVVYAVYQSLFTLQRAEGVFGKTVNHFSGLSQYISVFTDAEFLSGLGRVAVFAAVQVPVMIVLALVLALLLGVTRPKAAKILRSLMFLPYAVPTVIAGIMWASLYQPSTSPLAEFGISIPFLGSELILFSIANIGIWAWAGFNVLVMVTALTSISEDVLEAARIDGASELRIALSIKLPLIKPTIVMSTFFTVIGTLQLFSEPVVLRTVSSAISSGFTPNMLALSAAGGNDYSRGAAISVALAVITFLLSFAVLRVIRRNGES